MLHADGVAPAEPSTSSEQASSHPTENGTASALLEENVRPEATPAALPELQTEAPAFSTPEKDQLSSPHAAAAIKGQVMSSTTAITLAARNGDLLLV